MSEAIPSYKLPPDIDAGVAGVIQHRWSPRAFLDKGVTKEQLRALFEAARWAASCSNEQPWRFVYAARENTEAYQRILSVLVPKNQEWAAKAPVLLLIVAKKNFTYNNTPNRYDLHDCGAALAVLALQAASMGLQAHGMAGYDADKARTVLKIPHDFEPAAAVAIGYPGPPEMAPESYQAAEKAPRTRKPLSELAHEGAFDGAPGL